MCKSNFFIEFKLINKLFFIFFYIISYTAQAETVFELDFRTASGNVIDWFKKNNWESRKDISEMNLRFEDSKLVIEPTSD